MASAVLANTNEAAHWGEHKVYMKNYTKTPIPIDHNNTKNLSHFNRNPNPNPNFNHAKKQIHAVKPNNEPSSRVLLPSATEFHRKPITGIAHNDAFRREYVTFNLSMYTQNDKKELKSRLVLELEKVQALLNRIHTREIEARTAFQASRPHASDSVIARSELPLQKVNEFPKGKTQSRSKNKNKKLSGQKRVNANLCPSGREVKRPAVMEADKMMNKCKQILTKIMKNKAAWWFNTPVDVDGMKLFDYYQVIKTPMDLGSVKSKLEKNVYETPQLFASDVRLTFSNAMAYNPKGHSVHITAEKFLTMFNQMFKKFETEYNNNNEKAKGQMNVKPKKRPISELVPVKKVKNIEESIRDNNKQEKKVMSYGEKEMLRVSLEELQMEKGEEMLEIVRKRSVNLMQDGDEIELDIETLDDETLWELDRFVSYQMMKKKQQEIVKKDTVTASIKSPEVSEDVDVDIGSEDMDMGNNYPRVEIERDVSSSSGSSSSSSSGGSDSGSSSSSDGEDSVQSPFIESKDLEVV